MWSAQALIGTARRSVLLMTQLCAVGTMRLWTGAVLCAAAKAVPVVSNTKHPVYTLRGSGGVDVRVPSVVYGTAWKKERTEELVTAALLHGYRGFDTANQPKHYNESGVGAALLSAMESGLVSRADLFIQTKFTPLAGQLDDETLPYTKDAPLGAQVAESLALSLVHLHTDYIDSFVLHEQMAVADDMLVVWRAMEEAFDAGTVRLLGIANVDAQRLEWLLERCRVKPVFVQNRCRGQDGWDEAVRSICDANGIVYQGFWLITGNRELLKHPDVVAAAEWHERSPGQLLVRFYVQSGMVVLTGSTKMHQAAENLVLDFELSRREMEAIRAAGRSAPLTSSTKVEGRFWNSLDEPVNVLWRSPEGAETQSFSLAARQTPDDAKDAVGSTYHTHEFVFRTAADNRLVSFWRADASRGWQQTIEVNDMVDVTVCNLQPERVTLEIGNTEEVTRRELDAFDGNPLNKDCTTVSVRDGSIIVAKATGTGDVVRLFYVNAPGGGTRQTLLVQPHTEHSDEL